MRFAQACEVVTAALEARPAAVAEAADTRTIGPSLERLRQRMRAHDFAPGLDRMVADLDARTQADGFHVLHDWNGVDGVFNPDLIPIDVAGYIMGLRGGEPADRQVAAILLDYYGFHLLGLLALRVFDEGDAAANLRQVAALLTRLQGQEGSGHRFTDHAESLLLLATAHFETDDRPYDALLVKVRQLDAAQRRQVAIDHAVAIGCHLRFGFEATYGRDTLNMRQDNVADYPWLAFSLATLIGDALEDEPALEAIAAGLGPDASAFLGRPPSTLAAAAVEDHARFSDAFLAARDQLLPAIEQFRPTREHYTPLALFFNFSHNVLKGAVIDALLRGQPCRVSFNDLLTGLAGGSAPEERLALAATLMGYARAFPHRINGRLTPVIVYDPMAARVAFTAAMTKLRSVVAAR